MYHRILVAIDGSEPSQEALAEALRLATETHGQLRFVTVVDIASLYRAEAEGWTDASQTEAQLCDEGRKVLEQAVTAAREKGLEADSMLRESNGQQISDLIINEATQWSADLIVAGTHGRRGLGRLLLGSVASSVAQKAPAPLLLIRQRSAPTRRDARVALSVIGERFWSCTRRLNFAVSAVTKHDAGFSNMVQTRYRRSVTVPGSPCSTSSGHLSPGCWRRRSHWNSFWGNGSKR